MSDRWHVEFLEVFGEVRLRERLDAFTGDDAQVVADRRRVKNATLKVYAAHPMA